MNIRPVLFGSAAVLGTCLLAPSFLAAPANAAPLAPTVRAAAAATESAVVTDVTQEQRASGAKRWVRLVVSVSARTPVQLRDASGEVVQAGSATPQQDAVFRLEPTGADTARYTVVTDGEERAVDVDFRGLGLTAPVDQTDERGIERLRRAIVAGDTDHGIRYLAVPGAEVEVSANGRTETAVAGSDGIATVLVHFVRGENELSARQTLGTASSDPEVEHYLFDGATPGGGEDGSTVPSDDAFSVDVYRAHPLQAVDGKVTVGGTATRGEVTVSDERGEPLGTAVVQDGQWSIDVPTGTPALLHLRFDLRPERGGPVSDSAEVLVIVKPTPTTPFAFDRKAEYQRHDGMVHLEGTAPDGRVRVFAAREEIGATTASDGHWSIDVPLPTGISAVRFLFTPSGAGRSEEQGTIVHVVD